MEATLECRGICQLAYISGSQPPGQSMHSMIIKGSLDAKLPSYELLKMLKVIDS